MKIGVDIVDNIRMEKFLENKKLLKKIFRESELDYVLRQKDQRPFLGARWAAKEAVIKILDYGDASDMINIEVLKDIKGKPYIILHEKTLEKFKLMGLKNIEISISHEKEYSVAFVMGE